MPQTLVAVSAEELEQIVRRAVREEMGKPGPAPARYVDARAIAQHFGVSRSCVNNWVHEEDCPHLLRGKVLRFDLAAVEAWFRGREPGLKRVK